MSQPQSNNPEDATHDYPRAIAGKNPTVSTQILLAAPFYHKTVIKCLLDVPDSMYHMCLCAAAEVYQTGMVATAFESVVDLAQDLPARSKVRRRVQINELKKYQRPKLVSHLQSVGILPTGLGWLVVRWFVLPFLLELLKEWSIGPDEQDDAKSQPEPESDPETWI